MYKIFLILGFFASAFSKDGLFDLKNDLAKDSVQLREEHGAYLADYYKDIKLFKNYSTPQLSKFSIETMAIGIHNIIKLTAKDNSKLILFEVTSVLPGDTISVQTELAGLANNTNAGKTRYKETIKLKPHNFTYHTYIIQPSAQKKLVYQTEMEEGLVEYWIGNKRSTPIREAIALGQRYPDLNEILDLTTRFR